MRRGTPQSGTIDWYFTDHIGTPLLQTNADGTIVWRAEHDPYGTIHTYGAGATKYQPLRFLGQENDGEEERSYNIFRWYRSGWGRYTQADPAWSAERTNDINHYVYAVDNPVENIDPWGLCATCDDCPSGEWNFNNAPGFGVAAAIGWGKSVTWGTYVCKGNDLEVKVRIDCTIKGPIFGLGLGLGGPTGLSPMACACKENDLLGSSKGTTGWIGPFNIDSGKCGTKAGGTTSSVGVSKSWGAGFAATECVTKKVD